MGIFNTSQKQAVQTLFNSAFTDFAKPCKIWYKPISISCEQCLLPVDSTYSSNTGLHGGPIINVCEFCGGTRKIDKEVTDTLDLEVDFTNKLNRQDWKILAPGVKEPFEIVSVKGLLTDLPKFEKAIEVEIGMDTHPLTYGRYSLLGAANAPFVITDDQIFFMATLRRNS